MTPATISRFWSKIDRRDPDECWDWNGYVSDDDHDDGYGRFRLDGRYGRMMKAHRVAWILANGEITDDSMVLHRCDRRRCVNPAHLFLGDHGANMRDMARKGRARESRGKRNPNVRLDPATVAAIRDLYAAGVGSQDALARRFGISQTQVSRIVRSASWRIE